MIQKTLLLSGINLSGKLLGLLKIVILASIYGAGSTYDAYIIAYTLPTVLPQILTTIITTIFIPQFHKKNRDSLESWQGLNVLFTFVVLLSLLSTIVLYLFSASIVSALAPGANEITLDKAILLFEVMSISTFIIGVSSFFIALSNATERFYIASIDSLIINTIVILYCFIFGMDSNIEDITKLIIVGFSLHFIVLLFSNKEVIVNKLRFNFNYKHDDFIKPMSKSVPIIVGYIGAVSSGVVDQWFSSYENIGSISVLSYATMLYLLPMEVFGKAVMQTYFTKFSSLTGNKVRLLKSYSEGFKLVLFVIIPLSLYLFWSNQSLISLIFKRGNFSDTDAVITSYVLSALSLGLLFRIITYYNYRLLHSSGKSWSAISVGLVGVVINVLFNYILAPYYGLVGIALATTISLLISSLISCFLLRKSYGIKYFNFIDFNLLKIISSSIVCIVVYNQVVVLLGNVLIVESFQYLLVNALLILALPVLFTIICYYMKTNEIVDAIAYIGSRRCSKK